MTNVDPTARSEPAARGAPVDEGRRGRRASWLLRGGACVGGLLVLALEFTAATAVPTGAASADAGGIHAPAVRFFLVICLSACLAAAVHGVGAPRGAVAGLVAGMVSSMLMAERSGAPTENQLAFVVLGSTIFAALGYLAGGMRARVGVPDPIAARDPASASADDSRRLLESIAGRCTALAAHATPRAVWHAFDQQARELLREQLGAVGVRVLRVARRDGSIRPLLAKPDAPHALDAALLVAARRAVTVAAAPVCVAGDPDGASADSRPAWVLPLRSNGVVGALVLVRALRGRFNAPAAVDATRDALELLWQSANREAALRRARRDDPQTGLLHRSAWLRRLEAALAAARWHSEPLALLVIAIDGLRRLDDVRAWELRDRLVTHAAAALRKRVRRGDDAGRLSDDRVVVILRRADAALAERVATPLVESFKTELELVQDECGTPLALRVHAGLALHDVARTRFKADAAPALHDRDRLLARALGLLVVARARRRELVSDADATVRTPRDAAQFGAALDARERAAGESEPASPAATCAAPV
ncbi:MAG: diguanylate cyclase [Phycisphaerae bacterium]